MKTLSPLLGGVSLSSNGFEAVQQALGSATAWAVGALIPHCFRGTL